MSEETENWLERIPPGDRIYYTRLVFAIIAAAINLGFNFWGVLGLLGFIMGLSIIILSYFISVLFLGVDPKAIGGHPRGLIKGLGTSVLLFLVIWFLVFNFAYAATIPPTS